MALEATIVERLQELRRWQTEQQERLLQQQQEQRETFNREQIRMYQALGLSMQDTCVEKSKTESVLQDSLEDNESRVEMTSKKYEDLLKAAVEDVPSTRHMSPQRRHELLHNFSPSITTDGQNTQNSKNRHTLHEQKLLTNAKTNQSPIKPGSEFFDLCEKSFSNDTIDSDRSKVLSNSPENDEAADFSSDSHKPSKISTELFVDGIEPLLLDKPTNKSVIIDDIPLPSPKKDFHTLLEEKLRDSQYMPENDGSGNITKKPVKRPFLKKGQGLARFRSGWKAENSMKQIRPRTMSLPTTVRMENGKSTKPKSDPSNNVSKPVKKRTINSEKAEKKHIPIPSRAQSRLSLKNVKPPVRIRSKSMCNPREALVQPNREFKENYRFNISDIESKTKREMEELRIFELLEEKAENSSFCSTSSTVVALLQQSVQSTPLKVKSINNNNNNKVPKLVQNGSNDKDEANEDLLFAEIVDTTQSNNTDHNSSLAHRKQYQNDFGNLRGNKNLEPEDNLPQQFENHNVFDENSIDNICELPYGTDVDSTYGAVYPRRDETNYTSDNDSNRHVSYEKNTSLHVRFSEYNEYKTLTDTSTISTESEAVRHYSDQRVWSDCSATTDSSDVEEFASIIQRDQFKSLESQGPFKSTFKTIKLKKISGNNYKSHCYNDEVRKELSEGQYKDQYCNKYPSDFEAESEENCSNYYGGSAVDDVLNSGSEHDDDHESSEAQNEVLELADSTLVEGKSGLGKTEEESGLIFKSELLKTRLLELEREIEIFRKENIAVTTLKEKLQEERRVLERSFREKENRFEEYKLKFENSLQDEKKRLIREKAALENRLKDAHVKAQQSKQERLEVQDLRDQLDELKEEMNQKESRWNAAQARHRSQVRILQSENSKLKQEIEKLQSAKKANIKARVHAKHISSNTKAIHQINKQLESQKQLPHKQELTSDEEEFLMQPMMEAMHLNEYQNAHGDSDRVNSDGSRMIFYDRVQTESKNRNDVARKRDLYQNLLKDATIGLKEGEEATKKAIQCLENNQNLSEANEQLVHYASEVAQTQNPVDTDEISAESGFHSRQMSSNKSELITKTNELASNNSNDAFENYTNQGDPVENYISSIESMRNKLVTNTSEKKKSSDFKNNVKVDKQGIRELQHPDGRIEFWYPNGNVRKISADGTITKIIYYNGDVCESKKNGNIKYFYATTRTWHTTLSDGLEILEFPDGQVERRSKDGTVEVSFPDGSVRILQSNGTENWALSDGTLVETSADGEKILILPNGQREVHTKDHKRREYPDGTVKLVYPDGSQETRYANGRVRLKDKDGNLLMDSHHQ